MIILAKVMLKILGDGGKRRVNCKKNLLIEIIHAKAMKILNKLMMKYYKSFGVKCQLMSCLKRAKILMILGNGKEISLKEKVILGIMN